MFVYLQFLTEVAVSVQWLTLSRFFRRNSLEMNLGRELYNILLHFFLPRKVRCIVCLDRCTNELPFSPHTRHVVFLLNSPPFVILLLPCLYPARISNTYAIFWNIMLLCLQLKIIFKAIFGMNEKYHGDLLSCFSVTHI